LLKLEARIGAERAELHYRSEISTVCSQENVGTLQETVLLCAQ